jgi:hypothetical protein
LESRASPERRQESPKLVRHVSIPREVASGLIENVDQSKLPRLRRTFPSDGYRIGNQPSRHHHALPLEIKTLRKYAGVSQG